MIYYPMKTKVAHSICGWYEARWKRISWHNTFSFSGKTSNKAVWIVPFQMTQTNWIALDLFIWDCCKNYVLLPAFGHFTDEPRNHITQAPNKISFSFLSAHVLPYGCPLLIPSSTPIFLSLPLSLWSQINDLQMLIWINEISIPDSCSNQLRGRFMDLGWLVWTCSDQQLTCV